jgi:hypothetical protein
VRRKDWGTTVGVTSFLLLGRAVAIAWLNLRVTCYIESDYFRAELEKETPKGLHFPAAHYAPIHRKGFLTAAAGRFQADNGRKALRVITVHLSGTIEAPQQDLSPRIMEVLKENPGAALGLLLRQFGEWLKKAFGGE